MPRTRSSRSPRARPSPRVRNSAVSWPPIATRGRTCTPTLDRRGHQEGGVGSVGDRGLPRGPVRLARRARLGEHHRAGVERHADLVGRRRGDEGSPRQVGALEGGGEHDRLDVEPPARPAADDERGALAGQVRQAADVGPEPEPRTDVADGHVLTTPVRACSVSVPTRPPIGPPGAAPPKRAPARGTARDLGLCRSGPAGAETRGRRGGRDRHPTLPVRQEAAS